MNATINLIADFTTAAQKGLIYPAGEFTIKELFARNNIELTRLNQIKAQRKLNTLAEKGTIGKYTAKRGLESVYELVPANMSAAEENIAPAFVATKPEDVVLDFSPVTFGNPQTLELGYNTAGVFITATKTQRYASSKGCRYDFYANGSCVTEVSGGKAHITNLEHATRFAKALFA